MITKDEAITIARQAAAERGWRWEEPVSAERGRKWFLFGNEQWEVRTNTQRRGSNARFVIDARLGTVVEAFWLPR
jgi:hypothetical protein